MRPYAVYVPLCVKAIISNLILYLKRKVAHSSQSSTKPPAATKPQLVSGVLQMGIGEKRRYKNAELDEKRRNKIGINDGKRR